MLVGCFFFENERKPSDISKALFLLSLGSGWWIFKLSFRNSLAVLSHKVDLCVTMSELWPNHLFWSQRTRARSYLQTPRFQLQTGPFHTIAVVTQWSPSAVHELVFAWCCCVFICPCTSSFTLNYASSVLPEWLKPEVWCTCYTQTGWIWVSLCAGEQAVQLTLKYRSFPLS